MTLTCFLRCTHNMFECLLVYQAQSTRCLLHWSLTLFVQSLTLHSPRANQAHSNLEWKNRLLFWRNLLPWKLPFGCQVLVVLCAKAVITVNESLNAEFFHHICLPIIPSKCWFGEEASDFFVSGARALLTHAVLVLLYRGVALSLGRRLLILSKSWGARLSSPDSTRWSLELYL